MFFTSLFTDIKVRYLPEWFPGAGFQKKVKILRKTILEMPTIPFQLVKKELVSFLPWLVIDEDQTNAQAPETAKPSLTTTLLEEAYANSGDQKISEDEEELIRNPAGIVYAVGVILAALPHIQSRILRLTTHTEPHPDP
ncbi:hypothetical protein BU17DRAFT_85522 [Hysterangium stoloniferum]|nr:hypothetical protein BU17DRAFT_85522 [Hysterangium stoloniferum]